MTLRNDWKIKRLALIRTSRHRLATIGEAGVEPTPQVPEIHRTSTPGDSQATRIPTRPTETDPLAAFVASLTAEQRAAFLALLGSTPAPV